MNETRDWPKQLKQNAAACDLAKSIYYARSLVYGDGPAWDDLSPILHTNYMLIAQRVLEDLAPKSRLMCPQCGTPNTKSWCVHCGTPNTNW